MTRIKKSRKPGSIPKPKTAPQKPAKAEPRIPKKPKGNKPGSRNQVQGKSDNKSSNKANRDPRVGSKKPIDLTPASAPQPAQPNKVKTNKPRVAPIRVIDPLADLRSELEAIEADQYLQELLDRQDDGDILNDDQLEYISAKLERHDQLVDELGLDEEFEAEPQVKASKSKSSKVSDEDYWDKFDNLDLNDFDDE